MSLINSAKKSLVEFDFIASIHKIHLVLINLNNQLHLSEFWKKHSDREELEQLICFTYEFTRIVTILYKPILPELMIDVNKFIGNNENNIKLDKCFFRMNNTDDFNELTDELFNKGIKDGYFKIDITYKEKIFINKNIPTKNTVSKNKIKS